MAAAPGLAEGLRGFIAPPAAESAPATTSEKTRKQILDEVDSIKQQIESTVKTLEKIDTGRRKAEANRAEAGKGRVQVDELKKRLVTLGEEVRAMQAPPPEDELYRTFPRRRTDATKTLTDLSKKLEKVDKHLKRSADTIPTTAAPATDASSAATPAATTAAPAEEQNTKGIGAFARSIFGGKRQATSKESLVATTPAAAGSEKTPEEKGQETRKTTADEPVHSDGEEDEGSEVDDDDEDDDDADVVPAKKTEPKPAPRPSATNPTKPEVASVKSDDDDDSEDEDADDDNDVAEYHRLKDALQKTEMDDRSKDPNNDQPQSRSPVALRSSLKAPTTRVESTSTPSPKPKKPIAASPLPATSVRKKTPSPRRRTERPISKRVDEESEEDSYFEEDDEEDELRNLRASGEHEEVESEHDYDDREEEEEVEAAPANTRVQELRTGKYAPGTQFHVTHDLKGVQTGDLTIHKGEILTLVEQRPDDWWLLKNAQTQQQGVVPINHIQLVSGQVIRRRAKPNTSATVLVDAFKAANNMPAGFIPSDLAPLTQLEEYQLWRALVPKMNESNLAFTDLYWRPAVDKIHVQEVTWQKILTLKGCLKIPRVKGEQVRVLDRCVRVCLYDGFEIVSNIHTIRAHIPKKVDERSLTEDWQFLPNDVNTLIDEQPQMLIRSTPENTNQRLNLLIELCQWCQSTVTQEKCEVACGWCMVPIHDDKPPLISDTKGYDELLRGGHVDETNVLLDPQYKVLRSDGLSGRIDRRKRARIRFSIESRESDDDILYDNLPTQSIIVPLNLVKTLVLFRNELAYQLHKRRHPTGLSTTPIDSIFLSTFFQALEQPDLIYTLRRVYRTRQQRILTSSSSAQQQREEFIRTYELYIYPLLHYRQLPPYDFHDLASLNERRKLINDLIKRQLPTKKNATTDVLSILLDPSLTDKWTPFTTDEVSFTLQKYIHNLKSDLVA